MTYRFDQSSNTNSGHPLAFYLDAAKNTSYTTGVTTNGTAGSSGAYTQIVVTDATPPVLYYQCTAHAYMGSVSSSLTNGRLSDISDVNTATPTDGQALVWDNSNSYWTPGTVGGALTIQDEGSSLSTAGTTLNFVGAGVTASGTGATKTITISGGGGGSSLTVQDEGSALSTAATTLNFVGAGVTASGTGATKTIIVGVVIFLTSLFFVEVKVQFPLLMVFLLILVSFTFALFGFLIGLMSKNFEQMSIVPSLVITPMVFLGGSLYSLDMLPEFWQMVTYFNPVVYLINGLRYSFYGVSDFNIWVSITLMILFLIICITTVSVLLKKGYNIKT